MLVPNSTVPLPVISNVSTSLGFSSCGTEDVVELADLDESDLAIFFSVFFNRGSLVLKAASLLGHG